MVEIAFLFLAVNIVLKKQLQIVEVSKVTWKLSQDERHRDGEVVQRGKDESTCL